jgi:hypothetical protein
MRTRFFLFIFCVVVAASCRKSGIQLQKTSDEPLSIESRFLTSHRSLNTDENAIVEFVGRINAKAPFIEATVNKIGYPRWDKMIKSKSHAKSITIRLTSTSQKHNNVISESGEHVYYIPFVRDSQNYVNAAMVIKTSPTDTSINYMCDWQYARQENNVNKLNDKAEYFAVFFMNFDRVVFGHKQFVITDPNIFKSDGHRALAIRFNDENINVDPNYMAPVEYCVPLSIAYQNCPFFELIGHCFGLGGICDNCARCISYHIYTYCWEEWEFDGSSGGPSGPGGDGSGGGGTGGGGGSVPPDPCGGVIGGDSYVPKMTEPKRQTNPGVRTDVLPCGGGPGWVPEEDIPGLSVWTFSGDDGSAFIDNDPNTEVDLQFDPSDNIATQYPQLYQLVKNLKDFVKSSPDVMASLQHWSGFSKQQILDKLTFGQGPTVKVMDLPNGIFSQYRKDQAVNVLSISRSLAQGLEGAVLPATKRGTAFLVAVAILHEFVHYGTGQHHISEGAYDFGWGFERTAFDVIVNQNNANEVSIRFKKLP